MEMDQNQNQLDRNQTPQSIRAYRLLRDPEPEDAECGKNQKRFCRTRKSKSSWIRTSWVRTSLMEQSRGPEPETRPTGPSLPAGSTQVLIGFCSITLCSGPSVDRYHQNIFLQQDNRSEPVPL